jgi:hypothetical protein
MPPGDTPSNPIDPPATPPIATTTGPITPPTLAANP